MGNVSISPLVPPPVLPCCTSPLTSFFLLLSLCFLLLRVLSTFSPYCTPNSPFCLSVVSLFILLFVYSDSQFLSHILLSIHRFLHPRNPLVRTFSFLQTRVSIWCVRRVRCAWLTTAGCHGASVTPPVPPHSRLCVPVMEPRTGRWVPGTNW